MNNAPLATYRLQINPEFPFEQAERIAPYLAKLGVSHLYTSPVFAAARGSAHGYDVVDMNALNEEVGGEKGFQSLSAALSRLGMKIIQDIVPNHRAFSGENSLLMDVLENGPASKYYRFFDILWEHPYENIRGRVLAPFLGDFYGRVLERGELNLALDERGFCVRYWEHRYPIRPESYDDILSPNLGRLRSRLGSHDKSLVKFIGIIRFLKNLDTTRATTGNFNPVPELKDLLWQLYRENEAIRAHVDANLEELNGVAGDADSFDPLHRILSEQHFRLSYWKVGTEELNYRRFFSINDLICVRVEDQEVFDYSHQLVFRLVREGKLDGLRIDHLDGLFNPTEYLQRLRQELPDTYIVAEKILEGDEELPLNWPIQGTTGYDFLGMTNALFVDAKNEEDFDRIYLNFTGLDFDYEQLVDDKKRDIVGKHMAGDIDNLALMLKEIVNRERFGMDLTLYSLRRALVEILTQYPIYRTYATADELRPADREVIDRAIVECIEAFPILTSELEVIRAYLLRDPSLNLRPEELASWANFLMRLQQYTGPLMAKGVEDTVFYIYNRLTSMNEVGSDPSEFGVSAEHLHQFYEYRSRHWPHAMNTLATHDTKRGEDTRARINVLSEIPWRWEQAISRWSELNEKHRATSGRRKWPNRNDEYLFYQTLVGTLPATGIDDGYRVRMREFAIKAAREAKVNTSWLNSNARYEEALTAFVDAALSAEDGNAFPGELNHFVNEIAGYGLFNTIGQTVMKFTAPGVPDIYQGREGLDFSLVDPDNRRAVDFAGNAGALDQLTEAGARGRADLLATLCTQQDGQQLKLYTVARCLALRQHLPGVFTQGSYRPLEVKGPLADHVFAFVRLSGREAVVVIVGRFLARTLESSQLPHDPDVWKNTEVTLSGVPRGEMHCLLSGDRVPAADGPARVAHLLRGMPAAVLATSPP